MLITIDDIRAVRPVAGNINPDRVNIYIREAEMLDLAPAIGPSLYATLSLAGDIPCADDLAPVMDARGNLVRERTPESQLTPEARTLLEGGLWTDGDGCRRSTQGIRVALAYYAYARLVRNHSVSVTSYGVVTKMGDESNPATDRTIAEVAADARKIGDQVLTEALAYWSSVTACACKDCKPQSDGKRRKFIAIGD